MDSKTFVEILSIVRHDYLNHLQVISGFVQLNKTELVGDYIKQICSEMAIMSKLSHLKNPEISEFLLKLHYLGEKNQVKIGYNIDDSIESGIVTDKLTYILEEVGVLLKEFLIYGGNQQNELLVSLETDGDWGYLKIYPKKFSFAMTRQVQEKVACLKAELEAQGGNADIFLAEASGQLVLKLPVT